MQKTREQWLNRAVGYLRPLFKGHEFTVPATVRVGVGFAYASKTAEGQAWSHEASADGTHEIFLSPVVADPLAVLGILVHELIHVSVGLEHKHGPVFRRCALLLGLEGKMPATTVGEGLLLKLNAVSARLGDYPHAILSTSAGSPDKQTTRLLKMACDSCSCIIRTTAKWIEEYGEKWPCPCGKKLVWKEPEED